RVLTIAYDQIAERVEGTESSMGAKHSTGTPVQELRPTFPPPASSTRNGTGSGVSNANRGQGVRESAPSFADDDSFEDLYQQNIDEQRAFEDELLYQFGLIMPHGGRGGG